MPVLTDSTVLQMRAAANWLRRHFPVARRTYVYLRPGRAVKDDNGVACHGTFQATDKAFVIWIAISPDWHMMLHTLWHEFAHARLFPNGDDDVHHDIEYGEIRRRYLAADAPAADHFKSAESQ